MKVVLYWSAFRMFFLFAFAAAFASALSAEIVKVDPLGAHAAFAKAKGWGEPPITVDKTFIEMVRSGHQSTDEAAVARLVEALETTYLGAEMGGLVAPSGAYGTTYLSTDDGVVLLRLILNTVVANEEERREFFQLVEDVMAEDLDRSDTQLLEDVWGAYTDPTKRQFDHGWINLSTRDNRAMAWGVPPDFIEIVVTARTDCEFLPVQGWFARQICP